MQPFFLDGQTLSGKDDIAETATAVGVRLNDLADIDIAAPFGLHDLFDLVVRPTERFLTAKQSVYAGRVRGKNWQGTWPKLRIEFPGAASCRALEPD
ncbi:nucleotidyltransferase family protein [Janthinobacterium lividum]|uniref:nucleotidyltransferase family protein n=1 Tax=Janthinobacterium TaxID=29580 RepID=UPI001C5B840A|nr:nucleotidyltransferase family protein [Janthinobacterium sp. NKUCC06_STL]MCA1860086.1 nucleotidyltransferase family protein [Janthinobacterium lividum]